MIGMKHALAAAVVIASSVVASPARASDPAYAIIIGNNAPPGEGAIEDLPPLRYADDDAVRYHQLFSQFATTRLLSTLDEPTQRRYPGLADRAQRPTLENLRRAVADLAPRMAADRERGARPVFYLVFSGHGSRTEAGEAFLALRDGALTEEILFDEVLAELPSAYSHLLIDACHAGGVVGARGFFDAQIDGRAAPVKPERGADVVSRRIDDFPHVGFVVATTVGQEAHEWSEIEAGVFSHALLSALLGPADVNGDRRIEYSEVQAFVASATRGMPDPRAVPTVIAEPPRANRNAALVSLADLEHTRTLAGDLGDLGHFFVELENGQRYLDAHLVRGEQATIALPATGRAFLRTASREAEIPHGDSSLDELRFRDRAVAARGSLDASYRAALFSSAYGSAYYRGFVDSVGAVGVRFDTPRAVRGEVEGARPSGQRRWAIGVASAAGVSGIASITSGVIAYRAKRDFDGTDLQRPAREARRRYHRSLAVAGITGTLAVAGGLAAWWLWPDSGAKVAPTASGRGDYGLSLEIPF